MGHKIFSEDEYREARYRYGVTHDSDVTKKAEQRARDTGHLSEIVDPAVNPMRFSRIRLNPHQKKWIATLGCPMDIEVSCDTTGSMGGEVDTEMAVLPDLYEAVAKVLPGYDPQLCLGIFGDVDDPFVMCRPQFEMEAPKIVEYLKEMAPQRAGGDDPEDPQYAMFARAYLTDAYTNRIGLKGYHFIVTDATCHDRLNREDIKRIFGKEVFDNELKNMTRVPTMKKMIEDLKGKTHQFILVVESYTYAYAYGSASFWRDLCGEKSVIVINSTRQLPAVISAIIGLTEGTMDVTGLKQHLGGAHASPELVAQLSNIDIGAQAKLRHALPHPVPKAGDIFAKKGDTWPIQPGESPEEEPAVTTGHIEYL
jgi:hypothetical protein